MNPASPATQAKLKKRQSKRAINYSALPQLLGYQLRLTQVAVFRDFAEATGETQITPTLFGVLMIIDANPGLKQTELARAVRLDRSSVVSVIDKLERRSLVQRNPVAGDRRTNSLALTEQGQQLLAQLLPLVEAHEQRLAANLDADERSTLIKLLGKIFPESR